MQRECSVYSGLNDKTKLSQAEDTNAEIQGQSNLNGPLSGFSLIERNPSNFFSNTNLGMIFDF